MRFLFWPILERLFEDHHSRHLEKEMTIYVLKVILFDKIL